ncbi:imidazole glycerol phosphate synthase subunit HisH [Acetoanaerobium sticklandii]|uniref:imidazole glycerol phosphate synthase subunit HisH n=1 Tax=Acetoanaerobium sticklandii TaxID=1511 RepID=UPI003A943C67
MIGILDYNAGNLKSVESALENIEAKSMVITNPAELCEISGLIIPGVGSFKTAIENLKAKGFTKEVISEFAKTKKVLGICLGMQIFYDFGTEEGLSKGLGFFSGKVDLLDKAVVTPHMGWNQIELKKSTRLTRGLGDKFDGYFAHSYRAYEQKDEVVGICSYTENMPVIVAKDNIYGLQFHPEKSGNSGLKILRNFKEMCYENYTICRH